VQTGRILEAVESVLIQERPDWVLVYGDTNSTLAGALAAAKLHRKVAHVEAGLRSFNREMPEEVNRVLADHVSDLLLCPTRTATENLSREGITQGVHLVGDVMADAVFQHRTIAQQRSTVLERFHLSARGYALATVHRAENTDSPVQLSAIFEALDAIADGEIPVILPLHPRTRKALGALGLQPHSPRLRLVEPLPYLDMLLLEAEARFVLTDSGGVQKEAFLLSVPCLTLREETEWVETVKSGWNSLVGADTMKIVDGARNALSASVPRQVSTSSYGDGHAAERIVSILAEAQR
jgi:UDP-N-acetylglucosamine 2-epimerase